MIGVTIFGLLLTPVFYWVGRRLTVGARAKLHDVVARAAPALERGT
jgi:hypothetical protein